MAKQCSVCGEMGGFLSGGSFQQIEGKEYCSTCSTKYVTDAISSIIITTTNNLDGFKVTHYIDIESVEIVVGTGVFSEFSGGVADFFGARSTAFEQKLQMAKRTALDKLRFAAFAQRGNAVIAVDLDYTEFSGNRIGLIANGTIVQVEAI